MALIKLSGRFIGGVFARRRQPRKPAPAAAGSAPSQDRRPHFLRGALRWSSRPTAPTKTPDDDGPDQDRPDGDDDRVWSSSTRRSRRPRKIGFRLVRPGPSVDGSESASARLGLVFEKGRRATRPS